MEKIVIKNFLVIKEANFKVNKINIIIGSQANGKSLVAKLLYFCKEFLNTTYLDSIRDDLDKRDLERQGLNKFKEYFPQYTWKGQKFSIKYTVDKDSWVLINNTKGEPVKLTDSENLIKLHRDMRKEYRQLQNSIIHDTSDASLGELVTKQDAFRQLKEKLIENDFGMVFSSSLFIPAIRSIFANLQKNIFTLLASDATMDPFIKGFGSHYEQVRSLNSIGRELKIIDKEVEKIIQKILVGEYVYENGEDWIKETTGDSKVNLANASSGQQEALPMLLILSLMPFLSGTAKTYFIEEPEAHLFPVSQKYVVSLLSIIYKRKKRSLVITTHSPYILTAINNLILAGDVINEKGTNAVMKSIGSLHSIDYEDVSAYTIENGKMKSIMDKDTRLIGASIIDSVSEEFETDFDSLLSL